MYFVFVNGGRPGPEVSLMKNCMHLKEEKEIFDFSWSEVPQFARASSVMAALCEQL